MGDVLASSPCELIQVTAGMEIPKTRRRELGSLEVAMGRTGMPNGVVITLREDGEAVLESGRRVRIVPAWKWSLEA